jgi:hypothetical protein
LPSSDRSTGGAGNCSGILINLGLLVGLYGARKALAGAARDDHWKVGKPLYWAVMVSGIGMLLIRVSSSHGWWTGHLM